MTDDELYSLTAVYLKRYRSWPYSALARAIEHANCGGDAPTECLERTEFLLPNGSSCFLEITTFWDDRPRGTVRVQASLSVDGGVPAEGGGVFSNAVDAFLKAPDDTFIGEQDTT
jgi:hypothetical protein